MGGFLPLLAGLLVLAPAEPAARPPPPASPETSLALALASLQQALAGEGREEDEAAVAAGRHLGDAAAALEEAVAADPDDGAALHLLGLTYLELGRTEEAEAALVRGRAAGRPGPPLPDASPQALRRAVAAAAAGLAAAYLDFERAPPWQLRVRLDLAHDSNPNLLAEGLMLGAPGGGTVDGDSADSAAAAGLDLLVSPFFDRGGWSLGAAAEVSRSLYRDLGFLDLTGAGASVSLARGGDPRGWLEGPLGTARVPLRRRGPLALLLQAGMTAYWLDGSSYLRRPAVAAALVLRPAEPSGRSRPFAAATRLQAAYRDSTYPASGAGDPRRDGGELALGLHQEVDFPGGRSLGLGVAYSQLDAGRPFAATAVEGEAGARLPLGGRWRLEVAARLRRERYDHPESDLFGSNPSLPGSGVRRRDTAWWAEAQLARRLPGGLELALRYGAGERDSNLDGGSPGASLDYRRRVVGLSLGWRLTGGAG